MFTVASWAEHERQHTERLTAEDQAIEERAFSFATSRPVGMHLVPPTLAFRPSGLDEP